MKKQQIAVKYIILILCLLVATGALTGFILLGAYGCGICAVVSAACSFGIYRTKKPVTFVHFTGMLILASSLLFTQAFKGYFPWQYGFQKFYAENTGGFDTEDFFPDKLDFYSGNYRSECMPSIMQGSGWFIVSYDTNSIEECIDYCLYNCKVHFTVSELEYGFSDKTTTALEKMGYGEFSRFDIRLPEDISDSAELYVFEANFNWNHPHSKSVIIDGNRVHYIII